MSKLILENWEDYDNKKLKVGDSAFFSCEEEWERDFLLNKIREEYPDMNREVILKAMSIGCNVIKAPRPRETYVRFIANLLQISL